jgi:hypothetical protein
MSGEAVMVLGQRKIKKLTCEALWAFSVGIECCHSSLTAMLLASNKTINPTCVLHLHSLPL